MIGCEWNILIDSDNILLKGVVEMDQIIVMKVKDWDTTKRELLNLKEYWIFRGQKNACWPLHTSLERAVPDIFLQEVEDYTLQEIKRRAFHYLDSAEIGFWLLWHSIAG